MRASDGAAMTNDNATTKQPKTRVSPPVGVDSGPWVLVHNPSMCKTITHRVKFKAAPEAVYEVLADSRQHSRMTGKKATISTKIGGTFSARADEVTGVNVDLAPARRIVQAWRHRSFPEGIFSMAAVTLTPTPDGGTELVLTHRGVPKALIPETEQAWREEYWSPMKAYLDRWSP